MSWNQGSENEFCANVLLVYRDKFAPDSWEYQALTSVSQRLENLEDEIAELMLGEDW
jgi:hypothetical protein